METSSVNIDDLWNSFNLNIKKNNISNTLDDVDLQINLNVKNNYNMINNNYSNESDNDEENSVDIDDVEYDSDELDIKGSNILLSKKNTNKKRIIKSQTTYLNNYKLKIPEVVPECSTLHISTKSKISTLNVTDLDIKYIFWNINIIPYNSIQEGIIKKQIKYICKTQEELNDVQELLKGQPYVEEQIIVSINNPDGRIKFKDIRKISIGISKKDILNHRTKKKFAFYNCVVLIIRLKTNITNDTEYKEYHVKVFNTGTIKILGVQNSEIFERILAIVLDILQKYIPDKKLEFINDTNTVLTNSNFNCGFYIDQDILYKILKTKYKIHCNYDPTLYPGIHCKYYYDYNIPDDISGIQQNNMTIKQNKKSKMHSIVNFMIFSSGNILVVGKMTDELLDIVFKYIKNILHNEFAHIFIKLCNTELEKKKNNKILKKIITINKPNQNDNIQIL